MKEDRFSRLRAITDFGYNISWDEIHEKKVVVVGVGGLGAIISDQLARCGVGMLSLFDLDTVENANLNRMGFKPTDVGHPKVDVMAKKIKKVNPDVNVIPTHGDIMSWEVDPIFEDAVEDADLVMMGLDNYPARMFVNQKCINHKKILINAGVSRSALSGFVHPVIPGKNACLKCSGIIRGVRSARERSVEQCNASLPTTMAIISSMQTQEALKLLLNFGTIVDYITYNAITGQFNHFKTQKDKECSSCNGLELEGNEYSKFKIVNF